MVTVFFSTDMSGRNPPDWLINLRLEMANLCAMRWREEPCRMRIITPTMVNRAGFREPFQKSRRQYAEEKSWEQEEDFYIVVDDDILLGSMPIVEPMMEIMRREPSVGVLALHLGQTVNAGSYMNADLVQSHAVGGCRMIRRGMDLKWPPMVEGNPYQYDVQHGMAVEKAGYISAYTLKQTGMHLGSGYSLTWSGERHQPKADKPQAMLRVKL